MILWKVAMMPVLPRVAVWILVLTTPMGMVTRQFMAAALIPSNSCCSDEREARAG